MVRADKRQVTVLLDPSEDERFAAYCEARGYKKSTLIVRLIREHLNHEGFTVQANLFDDRNLTVRSRNRPSTRTVSPKATRSARRKDG